MGFFVFMGAFPIIFVGLREGNLDALDRFTETLASRTGLTRGAEVVRHLPRFEGTRDGLQIGMCEASEGDGLLLTVTSPHPSTRRSPSLQKRRNRARDHRPGVHARPHPRCPRACIDRAARGGSRALTQDQTREDLSP